MSQDDFLTQLFLACVQSGEIESSTSPKTAVQRFEKLLQLYDHIKTERTAAAAPDPAVLHERIAPKVL